MSMQVNGFANFFLHLLILTIVYVVEAYSATTKKAIDLLRNAIVFYLRLVLQAILKARSHLYNYTFDTLCPLFCINGQMITDR